MEKFESTPFKPSHMIRPKSYELGSKKLNQILRIDPVQKKMTLQPGVTQEEMAEAALAHGCLPPVVAEFRKITAGGAVIGSSLESSSFRYGQFNDACLSFTLQLGDGTIRVVSPEKDAELFYGISGSYGSLARLLELEISLIPASASVEVDVESYKNSQNMLTAMKVKMEENDFLEGIVFGEDHLVVSGRFSDKKADFHLTPRGKWFYQKALQGGGFVMKAEDYLFRHDRGAFWMGAYAGYPSLLWNSLFERKSLPPVNVGVPLPPFWCRKLLGPYMSSQRLYQRLHKKAQWCGRHFVIQDFYLPEAQVVPFIGQVEIRPLWICPVKATLTPQFLSPHYSEKGEILYDIGVYGLAPMSAVKVTKELEELTYQMGGRKMFYSHNFMNKKDFWSYYSKDGYERLRTQCHAKGVFPDLTEKIFS